MSFSSEHHSELGRGFLQELCTHTVFISMPEKVKLIPERHPRTPGDLAEI